MQTVNFQCGHCRNVMGVNAAYLGKQVRCPHCQQVVLAPAQAPVPAAQAAAPASAGQGSGSKSDDQDSIFGEHVDEDLFGSPQRSKVELPPAPPKPLQLEPTVFQVPGAAPSPFSPASNSSPVMAPQRPASYSETLPGETGTAPELGDGAVGVSRLLRRGEGNVLATSLMIILIPYSILVTVIALILYFNQQRQIHPLEMLPDLGNPPAKRVGQNPPPVLSVRSYDRVKADTVLPPHLIIPLGEPITIGDLRVTPVSVEQKRVLFKYRTGTYKPELSEHEALVLNLQLKNMSKDVEFRPTDVAFDHIWKDGTHPPAAMPYTYLELSTGKRYCGPFKWNPTLNKNLPSHAAGSEEYVEGQEQDNKVLQPGEEIKTCVLTDPADMVANALRNQRGKILWRVQFRRGIVHYKERDFSTSAVIGVLFDKDDIVKK
jgi:hypothetical protein